MRNVLADLALESEAAAALAMRLARAFDAQADEERIAASPHRSRRPPSTGSASAVRRSPPRRWKCWAATATSRKARSRALYRQMPLNSIWEGSGNVMCLDVLRAVARDARCVDAIADELALAKGGNASSTALRKRRCTRCERPT